MKVPFRINKTRHAAGIALALSLVVFVFDLVTPLNVAAGIFYIPLLFSAVWFSRARMTFYLAALGTALILTGYLLSGSQLAATSADELRWIVMMDRILTIVVLWIIAVIVYLRRIAVHEIQLVNKRLEEKSRHLQDSEQKLAEKEKYLQATLETVTDGIVTIDEDGVIQTANAALERISGYSNEELVGQNIKLIMPPHFHDAHDAGLRRYLDTGEKRVIGKTGIELESMRKDGTIFPMEIGVGEVTVRGQTIFVGIVRDISARKKSEDDLARYVQELNRSNTELDSFARAVSHDLKAPLRAIDNTSQWLEEGLARQLDSESRKILHLLRSRVVRMEKLLDDLLEYSRIGRVTDERYRETVTGTALVKDSLDLTFVPDNFSVSVSAAFAEARFIRMPLQHILMNLIGNAIKHHDRTRGTIQVELEPAGDFDRISIRDDGPGIAPEYQERIFGMFEKLHSRDEVEGSGLGLAMVKKQIEQAGGRIEVQSEIGKGSTFTFTWPKQPVPVTPPASASKPADA